MINHLLYFSNSTYLPYISCTKQLKLTGFSFEYENYKDILKRLTLLFSGNDDIKHLLRYDLNEKQSIENQNMLFESTSMSEFVIYGHIFESTLIFEKVIGTSLIELLPICIDQNKIKSMALPIYLFFESIPTYIDYKNSKYFILNSSTLAHSEKDYIGPVYSSFIGENMKSLNSLFQVENLSLNSVSLVDAYQRSYNDNISNPPSLQADDLIYNSALKNAHIAFVVGGSFDGSKQVIMSLFKHFYNKNKLTIRLTLIWVCEDILSKNGLCENMDSIIKSMLIEVPHVAVIHVPPIGVDSLTFDDKPSDGSFSFNEYCHSLGLSVDLNTVITYVVERLRQAKRQIKNVTPNWVREFWEMYIESLGSAYDADVVVIGNSGSIADTLIPEAFLSQIRPLGNIVTIVLDVAKLIIPHSFLVYHAAIFPSHYAQSAFVRLLTLASRDTSGLNLFVAQPGVHVEKLQKIHHNAKLPSFSSTICSGTVDQNCKVQTLGQQNTITVGFVGRLVPTKSPGMFLLVAQLIKAMQINIRFLMVGSGHKPFVNGLKMLAQHLNVTDIVEFIGKVSQDELPLYLAKIDILLNPSVMSDETFCVVNIEAMAVGLPIVSHGTYGQGEYFINFDKETNRGNSVIVSSPTAHSLTDAVIMLTKNATMRSIIGENAKNLVKERFHSYQAASRYMSATRYAHQFHTFGDLSS